MSTFINNITFSIDIASQKIYKKHLFEHHTARVNSDGEVDGELITIRP